MRSLRGEPVIVTFLYTTCEDTCPTQAQQVKGALDELGEDVPALAVAVDPPRDNPERARAFLSEQRMTGRMSFALGTRSELEPVWKGFAVQPQRDDLEHTARFVLVDAQGLQRVGFPLDQATPERIAHDIRLLQDGCVTRMRRPASARRRKETLRTGPVAGRVGHGHRQPHRQSLPRPQGPADARQIPACSASGRPRTAARAAAWR